MPSAGSNDPRDAAEPLASADTDVCQRIVEAVASARGDRPEAVTEPLYAVVDPGVLALLVESTAADTAVSYRYCGYEVVVDGD